MARLPPASSTVSSVDRANAANAPLRRIELFPHCSLSRRGAVIFFLSILAVSMTIAMLFASRGYWPILPFAGAELFLLGVALGLSLRRGRYGETILISDQNIDIIQHGRAGTRHQRFSRHWAGVRICPPPNANRPSRLVIQSHGRAIEVGSFLSEEDRRSLERRLLELIGATSQTPNLGSRADSHREQ